MKITELLKKEGIEIGGSAANKQDAIDQMVALMVKEGNIKDPAKYKAAVEAREKESTTAIGEGIAIPHAKTDAVSAPGLAAMTLPDGVDYDAPDEEPSDLIFLIAAPNTKDNVHLEVLSRLSTLLMDDDFTDALRAAKSKDEFLQIIDQAEKEKLEDEEVKETQNSADSQPEYPEILAVTACPTGIAHTYMAAEALEKKAAEMGLKLKAETQGSVGAKNILTREEIQHAKGVIIAADKKVDLDRFRGKQVLQTPVSDGINKPEELIQTVLDGGAPVLEGNAVQTSGAAQQKDSVWHVIYKHLMNGVSHMLPFVVGGGILTAIAFLIDQGSIGQAYYGMGSTAAAMFKTVGGISMNFMLPVLAGFIAMSIADRPGLAVGFVGGFLAQQGYTFAYLAALSSYSKGTLSQAPTAVSAGFIGALIAGFLGGYLTLGLEKLCDKLPDALEGIKPVLLYPLIGIFLIGLIMLLINPAMAALNTGISHLLNSMGTSNLIVMGAVVAAMMAVDMGGPINKAAYVFGTAALAEGTVTVKIIMASVMIGGMVPPLAIALSTTFFRNRWTKADRQAGVVNYIMGLSFITEGAIPYAAADPGRVLPSCIIGSALAGAMSAAFRCQSPAPHGGLWVVAVIGHPGYYVLSLLAGSVVAMLILSLLKKKLTKEEAGLEEFA